MRRAGARRTGCSVTSWAGSPQRRCGPPCAASCAASCCRGNLIIMCRGRGAAAQSHVCEESIWGAGESPLM
eukprot:6706235-Prymnesium_polylepis.1